MFCQLAAVRVDFRRYLLDVEVGVNFLGDESVNPNQRDHRQQRAVSFVLLVGRRLGQQLGAVLEVLNDCALGGGLGGEDHEVEGLDDSVGDVLLLLEDLEVVCLNGSVEF